MTLWILGAAAFLVTCLSAPLVRRRLIHHDILDRPNYRSSHQVPTPRGGGLACGLGVASAALLAVWADQSVPWQVLGAALIIGSVGFLDDRFQLHALPRLASQVVVGALLGFALAGVLCLLIGALLMPLIVNVVNFMDGINGISALSMILWGGTAIFAGLVYSSPELAVVGTVTAGSAAGFLPWNVPKAKLFLGDVGSYLFGALVAGGILLGSVSGVPAVLIVAPLSVYLLDVGVTLLRRARRGAPLTEAHRDHVYQQLIDQLKLPHIVVALWTTLISTIAVVAWHSLELSAALISSAALTILYLFSTLFWRFSDRGARFSSKPDDFT